MINERTAAVPGLLMAQAWSPSGGCQAAHPAIGRRCVEGVSVSCQGGAAPGLARWSVCWGEGGPGEGWPEAAWPGWSAGWPAWGWWAWAQARARAWRAGWPGAVAWWPPAAPSA